MPDTDQGWMSYIPYLSAGFGGLGSLLQILQTIERNQQMARLRREASNWQGPANVALSRLTGDAASRGWSGYPSGLAGLVGQAYAPYQMQSLALRERFATPGISDYINPFDKFLQSLMALKGLQGGPDVSGIHQVAQSVGGQPEASKELAAWPQ